ncbi:F420-dependent biliverdin reductase [soil metagenome]
MAHDPAALPPEMSAFLTERHLATLTTLRPDGSPHVVPVGFSWDPAAAVARVITSAGSRKAANAAATGRAVLCQVDGGRWLALEGAVAVDGDAVAVADAEARYAARYQTPRPNPDRVALVITVDRVLGRVRAS